MARRRLLEQTKIVEVVCYKEEKYAAPPGAPLDVQLEAQRNQRCDFGFTELTPCCKNCVWFDIRTVNIGGKPLVTDKEIERSQLPTIAAEMRDKNEVNLLPFQETARQNQGKP